MVAIEAQINGLYCICSTGVPIDTKISDNNYLKIEISANNKNITITVRLLKIKLLKYLIIFSSFIFFMLNYMYYILSFTKECA